MSSSRPPSDPRDSPAGFVKSSDFLRIAKIYGGLAYLGSLPGTPAEAARLRWGDVVVAVNGIPTPDIMAFVMARKQRDGGATVRFIRDGVEKEVDLVWAQRSGPNSAQSDKSG